MRQAGLGAESGGKNRSKEQNQSAGIHAVIEGTEHWSLTLQAIPPIEGGQQQKPASLRLRLSTGICK
jgi:hypothetical protein